MISDILTRETWKWNLQRINTLLPELASHILVIRPSILGAQESYVWPLTKTRAYSVKSGYFSLEQAGSSLSTNVDVDWNWKKLIWNPPLLPKLKFFLWRVVQNVAPSGENLKRRGLLTNTSCVRCGELESIDHILFHWKFAKETWKLGPWSYELTITPETSFKPSLGVSYLWKTLPWYTMDFTCF